MMFDGPGSDQAACAPRSCLPRRRCSPLLKTGRPATHFALSDKATGQCLDKESYLAGAEISSSLCNRHTPYRQTPGHARKRTHRRQPGEAEAAVSPLWIKGLTTPQTCHCDPRHRVALFATTILLSSHPLGQTLALTLTEPAKHS